MTAPPPDQTRAVPAVPDGLEALLPRFLDEVGKDINALRDLVAAAQPVLAAERAHAARGKCAMFGEDEMAALMAHLEERIGDADAAEIDGLFRRMVARATLLGVYDKR